MKAWPYVIAIAVVSSGLAACAGDDEGSSSAGTVSSAPVAESDAGLSKAVPADANIFGAGLNAPPAPAGGGGGSLPPVWRLPAGASRVVTFPSVSGEVNPIVDSADYDGPAGDHGENGTTNVESYEGISGIVHRENGMFLVGVFLTDDPPAAPAPPRLDFTRGEDFGVLEPLIGQTFFVGDGKGHSYRVPTSASRLYLGFADGFLYQGPPGWYDNNAGKLDVTAHVVSG